MNSVRWAAVVLLALTLSAIAGACGTGSRPTGLADGGGADGGVGSTPDGGGVPSFGQDGGAPLEGATGTLAIQPPNVTLTVTSGQPVPTQAYIAVAPGSSTPVAAAWSIDNGALGTIDPMTGVFTPSGTVGGTANVVATWGGITGSTPVTVHLNLVQNGGLPTPLDAGAGVGGNGGVGGEGEGGPVSAGTQQTLNGSPTPDPTVTFLYPYNQTVWPQGILPPLLQWTAGTHNFDGVLIQITEGAFTYKGYFAATATPFVDHPIDAAAWNAMAFSNQGETVTVSLVFSEGTAAYGPITETWKIAQGTLEGTVYYNSYGTNLAHNYCCTLEGAQFGGATLAVKRGSTSPVLIAGNDTECRVCHSVSANGAELITQEQDNSITSAYALTNNDTETVMTPQDSRFAWGGLYPDGTFVFSNSAAQQGANGTLPSTLYAIPAGTAIANTGLPTGLQAGCPVFSPDGEHVSFNYYGGPNADQKTLMAMDFAKTTNAFSNLTKLYSPPSASGAALWPSFLPTSDAVVFESVIMSDGAYGETRNGTLAELWWVDLKTQTAARLDQLNGDMYLPQGPNNHMADWQLNYEPTVNPVVSGGYAWVVFTSRRMYGNVATIDPTWSDPRSYNLTSTPTTKKLWVAALDLNAAPGTDPSHPAFYLPGQELLAGNSRGFWVVDPCQADGASCQAGDQCCGGYCQASPDGGLVCASQTSTCSQQYEKCMTAADCCGASQGVECINNLCAEPTPQ